MTSSSRVDAASVHSTTTLDAACDSSEQQQPSLTRNHSSSFSKLHDASAGAAASGDVTTHKVSLDKERIEEWVAKTQKQVELLDLANASDGDVTEAVLTPAVSQFDDVACANEQAHSPSLDDDTAQC